MRRDARLQSLFYISFRFPSNGALPPCSLDTSPTERDTPPLEPLSTISQSPLWRCPLQAAELSPHEERCPPQSLPFKTFMTPGRGALSPGSLKRAPISTAPFQLTLRVPSEWTPTTLGSGVCPLSPPPLKVTPLIVPARRVAPFSEPSNYL